MSLQLSYLVDYLYVCRTGLIDFVIIDTEIKQLNDYSVFVLQSVKEELEKSLIKVEHLQSEKGNTNFSKSDLDTDWQEMFDLETKIHWENNVFFVTPAMILVLLYVLMEKSLKNLCYSFSIGDGEYQIPEGGKFKVRVKSKESSLDAHLRYLRDDCGFEFGVDGSLYNLLDKCRKIRNDFAHGDWSNVQSTLKEIEIRDAFHVVSKMFEQIEQGMPHEDDSL